MSTPAPDPSTLTPLISSDAVLRAIDDDDIERWNEAEQRWDIASSAMTKDELTPGPLSGYGYSVFVERLLVITCGAPPGREYRALQSHASQHGCSPTWRDGIIARIDVATLATLNHECGESPADCSCVDIRPAHGSVWRTAKWTKKDRNEALKRMGRDVVFEHPQREKERLCARTSNPPTGNSSSGPP